MGQIITLVIFGLIICAPLALISCIFGLNIFGSPVAVTLIALGVFLFCPAAD